MSFLGDSFEVEIIVLLFLLVVLLLVLGFVLTFILGFVSLRLVLRFILGFTFSRSSIATFSRSRSGIVFKTKVFFGIDIAEILVKVIETVEATSIETGSSVFRSRFAAFYAEVSTEAVGSTSIFDASVESTETVVCSKRISTEAVVDIRFERGFSRFNSRFKRFHSRSRAANCVRVFNRSSGIVASCRSNIVGNSTVRLSVRDVLGLLGVLGLCDSVLDEANKVTLDDGAALSKLGALHGTANVGDVCSSNRGSRTLCGFFGKLVNYKLLGLFVLEVIAKVGKFFRRFAVVGVGGRINRHQLVETLRFEIFFGRQTKVQLATKRL